MPDQPTSPEPIRLPGVGYRLDLTGEAGEPVTALRLKDGTVELHGCGDIVRFGPAQAMAMGGFVAGHLQLSPRLVERAASALVGIQFDWVHVDAGAWAAGRSIEGLGIRRRTGTTIVAILRGSIPIVDPDPDQRIEAGDDLVIVGRAEDRSVLERYLQDGT